MRILTGASVITGTVLVAAAAATLSVQKPMMLAVLI